MVRDVDKSCTPPRLAAMPIVTISPHPAEQAWVARHNLAENLVNLGQGGYRAAVGAGFPLGIAFSLGAKMLGGGGLARVRDQYQTRRGIAGDRNQTLGLKRRDNL